jgi:hypothetical protein
MKFKLGFSVSLAIALSASLPAIAQTAPITRIESQGLGFEGIHIGGFTMIVPGDPREPAIGPPTQLLQIHVHFAKMYEITAYYCRETPRPEEIAQRFAFWDYQIDDTLVGTLEITCPEAILISDRFGTGGMEPTEIIYPSQRGTTTHQRNIPTLGITGSKIKQWIRYFDTLQMRRPDS